MKVYIDGKQLTYDILEDLMLKRGLPGHMVSGMFLYLTQGIPPGSFLQAVLENDLKGAVGRADHMNINCLAQWALFLYNDIPSNCQGSSEKVQQWIKERSNGPE